APDKEALGEVTWRWRVSPAEDAAADALLHDGARSRGARDAWIGSLAAMPADQPVLAFNDWFYENRVRRWTNAATALLRHRVESHAPFFDRDFVDRVLAAPI